MIYLASPYSHPDPAVRQTRYELVLGACAVLAQHKIPCYCPIALWHPVAKEYDLPGDADFWWRQDRAFLDACSEGWFLNFSGAKDSLGMKEEEKYLLSNFKPVIWLEPDEIRSYCELRENDFRE